MTIDIDAEPQKKRRKRKRRWPSFIRSKRLIRLALTAGLFIFRIVRIIQYITGSKDE